MKKNWDIHIAEDILQDIGVFCPTEMDRLILACMAYVDSNPNRATMATTPEQPDYTSVQERIKGHAFANRLCPERTWKS